MPAMATPVDALLTIDVGNSRIGLAVWDDDGLHPSLHLAGDQPESWRDPLATLWRDAGDARRRAVAVASVHPRRGRELADMVEQVCGCQAYFVRDDLPFAMPLDIENRNEVGVDRICSAVAAYERVGAACVVASFGTAITIDCISDEGRFMGGAILPGLDTSCRALAEFTSQLPHIQPAAPGGVFGRNTYEAINNGVVFGGVGALRELVERYATELGRWPSVLITGGGATVIAGLADFVDAHVPDLCLQGVALTYRRAVGTE